MAVIKLRGIVIGEVLYSESSKIIRVFNEDYGIVSIMAKGCRKPKSPLKEGTTSLTLADFDISYKEKGLSQLLGISNIVHFKNIILDYKDIKKKAYAFSIVELTEQIINQKNLTKKDIKEIYEIMISSILKIDEGFNPKIIFDIVLLKYLKYLGVLPCLDCCTNCGCKEIMTLSVTAGGFICSNCYDGEKIIDLKSLKLIKMLNYVDISKIKKLDIGEEIDDVHKFIEEYYEAHTGVYVKIKKRLEIISKTENII